MKKLTAALAVAGVIGMASYASAAQGDYVVVLKNPETVTSESITRLTDRIYLAPSYDAAMSEFDAENIESIFMDEPVEIAKTEYEECPDMEYASLSEAGTYPDGADDSRYSDQWYLPHIKATAAWREGLTGEGVKIGVIDTGINLIHVDLVSKTKNAFNCIPDADTTDVSDTYGHGAMVAGIIAANTNNNYCISGIVDDAELAVIKIMENASEESQPQISSLVTAISKAIEFECDVVNISLGFSDISTAGYNAIKSEIDKGVEKGIIFVASAGNTNPDGTGNVVIYPAAYDNVISVAALGREKTDADSDELPQAIVTKSDGSTITVITDEPAATTAHNNKVFCAAPGFKIVSTFIGSESRTAISDGTSFAAPMVASAAAIAKQLDPTINQARFSEYLKKSVRDVHTEGYDEYTGYGALDIEALIKVIKDDIFEPTPSPVPVTDFYATVEKNESSYTVMTMFDEAAEDFDIIAALYKDGRLVSAKKQSVNSGAMGLDFRITAEEEIDMVAVMAWSNDGIYPIAACEMREFLAPTDMPVCQLELTETTAGPTEAE